jgi:hypothetical protein
MAISMALLVADRERSGLGAGADVSLAVCVVKAGGRAIISAPFLHHGRIRR